MNRSGIILLLFLILRQYVKSQESVGDTCILQSTGQTGTCTLIQNCSGTIDRIRQEGILPQHCGFQHRTPIVCCVTILKNKPTLLVGQKSKQKCKEYEQYVYSTTGSVIGVLTGGSAPREDECAMGEVVNIVNGTLAKPREFPHMALVGFKGDNNEKLWLCCGSLISDRFVLTAAHCVFHPQYGNVSYVRLGDLDLSSSDDDAQPQDFNVLNALLPPNFVLASKQQDIALLELDGTVKLGIYVRPACLNVNPSLTNADAVASGWGQIGESGPLSSSLLKVTLEMFTYSECKDFYLKSHYNISDETQICAGSHTDTRDTCRGDSGGPLQLITQEAYCSYEIIGVTAFGKVCGTKVPGVYTRVSAFVKWIEDTVWPET